MRKNHEVLQMKLVLKLFVFFLLTSIGLGQNIAIGAPGDGQQSITSWQLRWVTDSDRHPLEVPAKDNEGWIQVDANDELPEKPEKATMAWIQIKIPELSHNPSALFIEKLYALNMKIFLEDETQPIYESNRNYIHDINRILLPVHQDYSGKTLSIWMETSQHRLGISKGIVLGDYQDVFLHYAQPDMVSVLLGGALLFATFAILVGGLSQNRLQRPVWIYLSIVILSVGVLLLSQFLLSNSYNFLGAKSMVLYDLSMVVGLLSLTLFFERVFGHGKYFALLYFRRFQMLYTVVSLPLIIMEPFTNGKITALYTLMTFNFLSFIIIFEFVLLVSSSITYMLKGNKDAVIFVVGFSLFAVTGIVELVWFYINSYRYDLFWWKWGLLGFMLSLIAILGRSVASNHKKLLVYAKELELFNNELRRSEKMDIISELAASVAHEVRNPLQVTRGFLQLLSAKSFNPPETSYIRLALSELDRASGIITDFLTFAKPEIDDVSTLSLAEEFEQVESILQPLASLHGGKIIINIPQVLHIRGNSSKFKQAIVNIVKNSIEAFQGEGLVEIWAVPDGNEVVLHIQDNGEGMEESSLIRLGEPYFSNKSKGTGLGLMVTFRIIEAMKGKIEFLSEKKAGTEAIIRLPRANE
ncbi:MAG: sensor histidine kinase [Gorillibacterium sp.]|nr:sensor histidine kinase [Gorillibacterium sp.]